MASSYGSKPDWSAFGGHGASLGDVEVVVRFQWRLVLDVVNPHLIGMAATFVGFHPANLYRKRRDPIRLKASGFPIPWSATLNGHSERADYLGKRRRIANATASLLLPLVSLLAASSIGATMSGRLTVTTFAIAHLDH